ncbi:MAG: histidine--tRNA ligase [Bacteroidia bacterium]
MTTIKPSLARGTRDFGPELMAKRKYIFNTIEAVFRLYGYLPLETPAMENLQTLTGKYGEEGDRLIFKILNSGDYLSGISEEQLTEAKNQQSRALTPLISEKALRYDLTVPLARYVSMHRGQLHFPFKRYQIQPVWRADRPQKGRYREFYQCDVDVIGSDSLFHEAELIAIYQEVFLRLGFKQFTIRINNRKLFAALAKAIGMQDKKEDFILTLDKLDKIGEEALKQELIGKGAQSASLEKLFALLKSRSYDEIFSGLANLEQDEQVQTGIFEMKKLLELCDALALDPNHIRFDLSLARGLDYYTGTIMEVVTQEVAMGSIGGGGRYDNLTGIFGVDGLTGVGVSFGAERILDVMEQLELFPEGLQEAGKALIFYFSETEFSYAIWLLKSLRTEGIAAELYTEGHKMKKAFQYAEARHIPYLLILGDQERESQTVSLKHLASGEQERLNQQELIQKLR